MIFDCEDNGNKWLENVKEIKTYNLKTQLHGVFLRSDLIIKSFATAPPGQLSSFMESA